MGHGPGRASPHRGFSFGPKENDPGAILKGDALGPYRRAVRADVFALMRGIVFT